MTTTTTAIATGASVLARTAFGEELPRVAVGAPERGHDFLVVRVCTEKEWAEAASEGREPSSTPWPAEDVRPA